jgi:hypothetical protein
MDKFEAVLIRQPSSEKQTLGELTLYKNDEKIFSCKTLELAWKDNKRRISCIPAAEYDCVLRNSPKYGNHFHVKDVPGRTWILIHGGNYYSDILGCILVGNAFKDINKDKILDVVNSKATLKKLLEKAPNGFKLTIKWA